METQGLNASLYRPLGHDPGNRGFMQGQIPTYKEYKNPRRIVQASPNQVIDTTYGSPVYSSPRSTSSKDRYGTSPGNPIDMSSFKSSPTLNTDSEFVLKNPMFHRNSPNRTSVSMPGGYEYDIPVDNLDSPRIKNDMVGIQRVLSPLPSGKVMYESHQRGTTPRSSGYQSSSPYRVEVGYSPNNHGHVNYLPPEMEQNLYYHSKNSTPRSQHDYTPKSYGNYQHQVPYGYVDPYLQAIKQSEEDRREERKVQQQMMETINELREELSREKEQREKESQRKHPGYRSPNGPGYTIPQSEPVPAKTRTPDYEMMNDLEREGYKEKFRNNYNLLKVRYPKWDIEVPDFNVLPMRTIHERYEDVVRMICIYQTAMKLKVYLVVMFVGIEYYVGYTKEQAWCRGLLESQIKTIHKFDTYLIELATMFYSDEPGEEYPLWMRFLGTFASGLATFGTINGTAKSFGMSGNNITEQLLFEADKFVSPPEGTAKLHSDGISDVPEPPEPGSFQEPNTAINGIGYMFNMAKGFFGGKTETKPDPATATPQTAIPINPNQNIHTKKVTVDDLDDADL